MFQVRIPPRAQKFIKHLPSKYRKVALESLEDIKLDPLLGEPLGRELKGSYSYRFGVYRIVYKINKTDKIVEVTRIDYRSKAYN